MADPWLLTREIVRLSLCDVDLVWDGSSGKDISSLIASATKAAAALADLRRARPVVGFVAAARSSTVVDIV